MDEKPRPGPIEAAGDFEDAFREHFGPVYRFIARRVGTDLAEDLAAEVFATAYRRRASYDPGRGSLRSWLFGIAANVVRAHWRDEQQLLELDARLAQAGAAFRRRRGFPGGRDRAGAADRGGARGDEPGAARRAAAARLGRLSHEEISAALGIANGTARSRLSRARAALRAQLGEFDFTLWAFKKQGC